MPESVHLLDIHGTPSDIGRVYGKAAGETIRRTVRTYQDLVQVRSGLSWSAAVDFAQRYDECIGDLAGRSREELQGIAHGADVPYGDVLALNCRSELLFVATGTTRPSAKAPTVSECSSFAVVGDTRPGVTLAGQNWDWNPSLSFSTTVRGVAPQGEPSFLSVSEAGHLAKVGLNASGLGVFTNTLVSTTDDVRPGLPYHVLLRELLRFESVADAVEYLASVPRAMSANYLLVDRTGDARDVETAGGGTQAMSVHVPEGGVVCHTNHFIDAHLSLSDVWAASNQHTFGRLATLKERLAAPAATNPAALFTVLRDHVGFPNSLCSHPSPGDASSDQRATLASVVVDMASAMIWVAPGYPCATPFKAYSVGGNGVHRVPEFDERQPELVPQDNGVVRV